MYKRFLGMIILAFPLVLSAQSQEKSYYSITVGGGFTSAYTSSTSNDIAVAKTGQSFQQYNDSITSFQTGRFNWGVTLWYHRALGINWSMQAGIGYVDMGFRRQQKNIALGDYTYPGIGDGRLIEFSNTKKSIDYDYRFHYVQVPVWFNYHLFKSSDYRTTFDFTTGLSLTFLAKHRLTARLNEFKVDEKDVFQLDSTGYDARTLNAQFNLGFRIEHKLEKDITLIFQPMYSIHPFSLTNDPINVRAYSFMLNAGIVVDLENFKN